MSYNDYINIVIEFINDIPYNTEIGIVLLSCLTAYFLLGYCLAKLLRYLGYRMMYYFVVNVHNLEYYCISKEHIQKKFRIVIFMLRLFKNFFLFTSATRNKLNSMVRFYAYAVELTNKICNRWDEDHYFAFSELSPFDKAETVISTALQEISSKEFERFLKAREKDVVYKDYIDNPFTTILEQMRLDHNKQFTEKELTLHKGYFDSIFKYPLDIQQRTSLVKLEDNCQVISSAGSGKTLTSMAKVKYLIDKRGYSEKDILVLSYNRDTAEEFRKRLNMDGVECCTFHSLAMRIVSQVEGQRPDICEPSLLINCFYELASKNPDYKKLINEYFSTKISVTQGGHYYNKAEDYYKDRATYGVFCPYTDRNGNTIFTKSEEEKKICVWLVHNGIDFEYERPYHVDIKDPDYRQYKPDFSIFFKKNGLDLFIYYEHFGIDKNGDVPIWFGEGKEGFSKANARYREGMEWKRNVHKQHGTALLETTSAMFHDGTIFEKLKQQLNAYGIEIKPISEDEKFQKLFDKDKMLPENAKTFFDSFISLMKSNKKSIDSIFEEVKTSPNPYFVERNRFLLYEIIKPLYDKYESELRSKKQCDYVDLIIKASNYISRGKYVPEYKYIIVDEFQDISIDRYKLLTSLRTQEPLTKLYCVGDDWQSIYRFSGSDINLFNNFSEHFGFTEICKNETTYRFGNPLINASSEFILENPNQVKKEVKPAGESVITNISCVEYASDKTSHLSSIDKILDVIPKDESVLLIGRYVKDVDVFPQGCVTKTDKGKRATVAYHGFTMKFMSIHASKGLEADHVILLNCSSDSKGFPSRVADDPILGYVLSKVDDYLFSEERRLFYVAITRAKKHTWVLYNSKAPSPFVGEMQRKNNTLALLCPMCKSGNLVESYRSIQKNNLYHIKFRCSNRNAHCDFYWKVFDISNDMDVLDRYVKQLQYYVKNRVPYKGPANTPILYRPDIVYPKAPVASPYISKPVTPPVKQSYDPSDDLPF